MHSIVIKAFISTNKKNRQYDFKMIIVKYNKLVFSVVKVNKLDL